MPNIGIAINAAESRTKMQALLQGNAYNECNELKKQRIKKNNESP